MAQSSSWHRNHWARGSTSSPNHGGNQCAAGEHSSSPPCFCDEEEQQKHSQSQEMFSVEHLGSLNISLLYQIFKLLHMKVPLKLDSTKNRFLKD